MNSEGDREYHRRRASMELDLAYRASAYSAMAAHLRLSSLHMAAMNGLAPQPSERRECEVGLTA